MRLWACPNGCGSVRGPERPRTNASCRYCLACSAKSPTLVERTCAALEARRTAKAERRQARARKNRALAIEGARRRRTIENEHLSVDIEREWARIWATPSGRDVLAWMKDNKRLGSDQPTRPTLTIRRSDRGGASGHAQSHRAPLRTRGRVVLTIGNPTPWYLLMLLLHECGHVVAGYDEVHGPGWRAAYRTLVRETYGIEIPELHDHRYKGLDVRVTAALAVHADRVREIVMQDPPGWRT